MIYVSWSIKGGNIISFATWVLIKVQYNYGPSLLLGIHEYSLAMSSRAPIQAREKTNVWNSEILKVSNYNDKFYGATLMSASDIT